MAIEMVAASSAAITQSFSRSLGLPHYADRPEGREVPSRPTQPFI